MIDFYTQNKEASTAEGSLLDAMGRVVRIIEIEGQTLR